MYVFIGPPGAGKGSLAQLCKERLGWHTLATGDLCRAHIASQTEIGKEIDFSIKSGKLVSDETIAQMVTQWLSENINDVPALILDGFPRTYKQACLFEEILRTRLPYCRLQVVELFLADASIIKRLGSRRLCSNTECQAIYTYADTTLAPQVTDVCDTCNNMLIQREDDNPDVIEKRLQEYRKHADPLLRFYYEKPEFLGSLHVDKPLEDVYKAFMALLDKYDTNKE